MIKIMGFSSNMKHPGNMSNILLLYLEVSLCVFLDQELALDFFFLKKLLNLKK